MSGERRPSMKIETRRGWGHPWIELRRKDGGVRIFRTPEGARNQEGKWRRAHPECETRVMVWCGGVGDWRQLADER